MKQVRKSNEVNTMPNSKKRPRPVQVEPEIRPINPTKSKVGKIIIIILAAGMFIGMVITAIAGMISVLR